MVKSRWDLSGEREVGHMRGIDGNYLNTQGDASARLQMAYQTEQNRQQVQAQVQATDALRKLREQVNETLKKEASPSAISVRDEEGTGSKDGQAEGRFSRGQGASESHENDEGFDQDDKKQIEKQHIDIKI